MKYTLLLLLFLGSISLFGQQEYCKQSKYALVYKITDEQALELAKVSFEHKIVGSEASKVFNSIAEPFDTIFFSKQARITQQFAFQKNKYPLGHYVMVGANGEYLEYNFLAHYDVGIVPIYDKKKFYFHIVDIMGQFVKADNVTLDGKKVKYNSKKERYEFKKFKKSQLLVVERNGEKSFFEVDADYKKKGDFYDKTTNWFVKKWDKIIYANIWRSPMYALGNTWRRIYLPFKYQWEVRTYGYVTTNKPKYLPQDTVKIKAYLTRDNKIAYNSPLTLKITNYGNYKFETIVKPTSKGNYIFEFPLGDTLTLDKQYQVEFWKGNRRLMQTYFNYEDYQLDEVSYNLRADQKKFKRNEPIVFYAEGKDANNRNVMDGDVEITAKISNIRAYHAKQVYTPDTLFHYKGALDLGDAMKFPLEKSIIPMADFTVNIYAVFTNSNGELHHKNLAFEVISDTAYIDMRLDGDTILVDYLVNDKSVSTIATLDFNLEASNFFVEKTVQLPYKAAINPVFSTITAKAEKEVKTLTLKGYNNDLIKAPTFDLVQTNDSVFVFGYNPSGLVVHYEINRINRKIAKGSSSDKLIVWKDKIRKKTSYRIDYEYVRDEEGRQGSQKFDYAANMLTIEIDQPTIIQPGETIDVKVKVKNSKNRNARNVNLVAGAINTQFKNANNWKYNAPFYGETSKHKSVPNYNRYSRSNLKYSAYSYESFKWRETINNRFRKDLDIDKELYYRLLFADSLYQESVNLESNTSYTQFAPFVVKNGKFQPVCLIYKNRLLAYYHETETPYSFRGQLGYNQLILRGQDFEIVIDSVYMKPGKKLFLSINMDNLPKNAIIYDKPLNWTSGERKLLQKSIFTYRHTGKPTTIYLWQSGVVYSYKNSGNTNFGPFTSTEGLSIVKKNQFQSRFKFEPGFIYEIEKSRERLYHNPNFPDKRILKINTIRQFNLSDEIRLDKNIPIFDKPYVEPLIYRQIKAAFKTVHYAREAGMIRYRMSGKDSLTYATILIHQQTQKMQFYAGNTNGFRGLKPGDYTIYGYTKWGNYFKHEIRIRKDTMLYEHLENIDFQKDENLELLKSLLALKDIIIPSPTIGKNNTTKPKNNITYSGSTYSVSGQVTGENGEAVMFATVLIKGTTIGTTTDLDGNYRIQVPKEIKNPVLVVSYLGFSTTEFSVNNTNSGNYDLSLTESLELDEVVVTALGVRRKEKTTAMSTMQITKEDIQRLPSKNISRLLGQVAGVSATTGGEADLAITIQGSRSDATDYYVDGIKVTGDTLNFGALQASSKIRSRFQDYAFWQPNLITDGKGEATFRVTYPDDITSYQTFVLGMDRKQKFGIATKIVKSQKVALAQLSVPRFMIQGDKAKIIGKSLNYSNDSLQIKSTFLLDDNLLKTNDFWLKNAKIETTELFANTTKDTLQLTYKMEHPKFFDGEKRPIPIYRKGTEETLGSFNILRGDTTITLNFDEDKGNVKIYAQTDILDVLLDDVQYLIDYPYGCNEQTASRLLALLMDKQIKSALGRKAPDDKPIVKMVKRLEKSQNEDGSWGWWTGSRKDYWMTNYVLKALYAADTSGYKTKSYEIGLRFITNSLEEIPTHNLLNSIELLSDVKQNMDYEKHLIKIDSTIRYNDYYNQLRMVKVKQQQGLNYDLLILDSLENQTLFGNIFYDINKVRRPYSRYYYWYANHYNLSTLAYQILRNESLRSESKNENESENKLAAIRGYFLEKRTRYGWRNTFTTAQILSTILPDIVGASNRIQPKLVIKGNTTETVTAFPFETTFYANTPLEIQKTGTSTVYVTGYQQFWNETPKPKNDIFELKSKLIQGGKVVKKLESKTATKMVVTLEVKKEAEYVMVEVPIPAGCSYGEKSRNYGWYGREVHREYFREKTCVFYKNLSVGIYTITINLEPRFTGEYTVNPAKAEQMYFPVFYGRNAIKEVEIIEK